MPWISTEAVEFDQHVLLDHSMSDDDEYYLPYAHPPDHGDFLLTGRDAHEWTNEIQTNQAE